LIALVDRLVNRVIDRVVRSPRQSHLLDRVVGSRRESRRSRRYIASSIASLDRVVNHADRVVNRVDGIIICVATQVNFRKFWRLLVQPILGLTLTL
jgi:hypothetical protein